MDNALSSENKSVVTKVHQYEIKRDDVLLSSLPPPTTIVIGNGLKSNMQCTTETNKNEKKKIENGKLPQIIHERIIKQQAIIQQQPSLESKKAFLSSSSGHPLFIETPVVYHLPSHPGVDNVDEDTCCLACLCCSDWFNSCCLCCCDEGASADDNNYCCDGFCCDDCGDCGDCADCDVPISA